MLAVFVLCAASPARAQDAETARASINARAALTAGVTNLVAPGALPGTLAVFGEKAFVVLTGQEKGNHVPLAAAAALGKGRIFVIGHEAFVSAAARSANPAKGENVGDNALLLANVVYWLRNGPNKTEKGGAARVGVLEADYAGAFKAAGATVTTIAAPAAIPAAVSALDVLYLNQAALDNDPQAVRAVRKWVKRGGGVILAGPLWGWRQVTGKDPLTQHSGNQIARDAGIAFADSTAEATGKDKANQDVWLADAKDLSLTHAQNALDALTGLALGAKTLTSNEQNQATAVLTQTLGALRFEGGTSEEKRFVVRTDALTARYGGDAVPSKVHPISAKEPFARLRAVREHQAWERTAPEKIKAHPAAANFPGVVPADALRITQTVTINCAVPDWHSVGLYAAPGEVITVTLPQKAVGKGIAVRIGSHTDTLWHLPQWERFPDVSLRREIAGTTLRLASPFGGAIFVDVPEKCDAGQIAVKIAGAVVAPHFVRGVTNADEWRKTLRNAAAPWAELEGKRIILSVPSYAVRNLDDPDALMAYWDEVADLCADLYAIPRDRPRPERYCVDVQISAGYMHSGYPLMTGDDVAKIFTDLTILRGTDGLKTWGFYHELGHNHQQSEWTFDGTGEVTNNLFSLYGGEKLNGVFSGGDYFHSHPAVHPNERNKRKETYLASGAKFADWQNDPFLALTLYIELRRTFGWEPFQKVFAEYRALPPAARPTDEREKRSQWMVRFSKAVNRNLAPFFASWGIPVSDAAKKEVESLPEWVIR